MLPGQTVNLLNVPMQSKPKPTASPRSSIDSLEVFTLDPKDKYIPQGAHRAASTSAIQSRKNSIATILTQKSIPKAPCTVEHERDSASCSRPRSLASVFDSIRQTRSAGSSTKSGLSWPRKLFSSSGSRGAYQGSTELLEDVPPVPRLPSWVPEAPWASREELEFPPLRTYSEENMTKLIVPPVPKLPSRVPEAPWAYGEELDFPPLRTYSEENMSEMIAKSRSDLADSVVVPWPTKTPCYTTPVVPRSRSSQSAADKDTTTDRSLKTPLSTGYGTPLEQLKESNAFFAEPKLSISGNVSRENLTSTIVSQAGPTIGMRRGFGNQALYWEKRASEATSESKIFGAEPVHPCASYTESSTYSYDDEDSPYLTTNTTQSGPMSPLHLSQPETPITGDFEDDYPPQGPDFSSPFAQLTCNEMAQSMKPPSRSAPPPPPLSTPPPPPTESDPKMLFSASGFQGYSLPDSDRASVLTLRKSPSTTFKSTNAASPFAQQDKQDMVHSWNDGNPHRLSALGELMEDLGYLGDLIS